MRWVLPLALLAAGPVQAAEQMFPLAGFTAVTNAASADLEVRVGRAFRVVATGDAERLARLRVEVRGDTLVIESRGGWSGWRSGSLNLLVELPALTGISLTGSGDGRVDAVKAADFRGATSGSGDLLIARLDAGQARLSSSGSGNLAVAALSGGTVTLSTTGSGDIMAAGRADRLDAVTTGSGDLALNGLAVTTLAARSTGSGDIEARATGSAEARTSGSGDVTIAGTDRCRVTSSGSGNVRCG